MIGKLVRQMLLAQTMSALTVSLCLLIDNIMIGRFLGDEALTAYSLANPILLVIGALGSMLCAGVQVACSRSLGRGSQEETNVGYSSAIAIAAAISAVFVILVLTLRVPLARFMGADDPELLAETSNYMAGFTIGAPASMAALILVPFLQMAGQSSLLIAAVAGMTVADVGLDLLNVLVFKGGMFGMGLASSISYYVAMIIGGWYFLSKKSVFRFSLKRIKKEKIKELFSGGVPSVIGMAASVVLIFIINRILKSSNGNIAVAAFAVVNSIGNACNCISTGSGGVSLTLSGILYNEEDRTGLKELLGLMVPYAAVLGAVVTALVLVFAPACVSLFIPGPGQTRDLAVAGLRFFSLGLMPCCINYALRSCYQGTGSVTTMEVISAVEGVFAPAAAAFILGRAAGVSGVWFYFLAGELITMAGILIHVWIRKRGITLKAQDILLLERDMGVPEKDMMEGNLNSLDEVMDFSNRAYKFCLDHGADRKMGNHLALCIEEMGSNIVTHGFEADKKDNHLYIRLQYRDGKWVLRFRDDCRAFDPVAHMPSQEGPDKIGIRLAMHMADEARYTYSLNLNNLMLIMKEI